MESTTEENSYEENLPPQMTKGLGSVQSYDFYEMCLWPRIMGYLGLQSLPVMVQRKVRQPNSALQ